jgi:hypothetical protein
MPNWNEILDEIKSAGSAYDVIRRKYLKELSDYTGRNVIVYYSGWLQKRDLLKQGVSGFDINDEDKTGFMSCINKLDKTKGLDLLLHTPGGELAATESIVEYFRLIFGANIRTIIPQIAMSAGTMIACSCKEIVMGKHSNIGPIDPQFNNLAAHGIIEEFKRAYVEISRNPVTANIWQPIIAKYNPTLIGECEKAIKWSTEVVSEWLRSGMLKDDPEQEQKIARIVNELGDHALTKSHSRHISAGKAIDIGLKVSLLEDDQELQDKVLSVHHTCIQTLEATPAIKIIENQNGIAYIKQIRLQVERIV